MAIVKTDSAHYSNIAAKIREKTGEATTYKPSQMADGIEAVYEAGKGAGGAVIEKDVNFYDYDGTLLHSYTLDEVQSLTELPPLPTQEGLICQEWNWTLAELKALGRPMTVGATYITDDGATRLVLEFIEPTTIPLTFQQNTSNGITIDWGDGSATETVSGTGTVSKSHTYSAGSYTLSLTPIGNCTIALGGGGSAVFGSASDQNVRSLGALKKVFFGKGVSNIAQNSLRYCVALEEITLPKTVEYNEGDCMNGCYNLRHITYPRKIRSIANSALMGCAALRTISLSSTITGFGNYVFNGAAAISRLDIPSAVASVKIDAFRGCTAIESFNCNSSGIALSSTSAFRDCKALKSIKVSEGQTQIPGATFYACLALVEIDIPSTITNIEQNAFAYCYAIRKYNFTKATAIPTLGNTNAFTGIQADCIIVVPDNLLTAWKAATNWSTYASYIKGASEV